MTYDVIVSSANTQSTSSTTSSTSQGFEVFLVAPSGQSLEITVAGNISSSQVSNMSLEENSTSHEFLLTFTTSGAVSTATLAIPKSAVPDGYVPLVYDNGPLATDQSYYSDQSNYYVTFSTHLKENQMTIIFSSHSGTNTQSLSSPVPPPVNTSSYEIFAVVASVVVIAGVILVVIRRRHSLP